MPAFVLRTFFLLWSFGTDHVTLLTSYLNPRYIYTLAFAPTTARCHGPENIEARLSAGAWDSEFYGCWHLWELHNSHWPRRLLPPSVRVLPYGNTHMVKMFFWVHVCTVKIITCDWRDIPLIHKELCVALWCLSLKEVLNTKPWHLPKEKISHMRTPKDQTSLWVV